MTIPSFRILKSNAAQRVEASPSGKKVVLVYSGIITLMALLVTGTNFILDNQIAQTGGLSNMGLRTILSTIQSVLPMIQSAVVMCLEIGYLAAVLRISRRQYTSEKTLKLGFDRFWLLLRSSLLQTSIFMAVCMAALWIAGQLFLFTPFGQDAMDLMAPYTADPAFTVELLLESDIYPQLVEAMLPMLFLFAVLYTGFCIPLTYSFRMVNYVIIDKPGLTGMAVLRESRKMMRGSRMRLFRLDLSLWWWHALTALLSLICYGDMLLSMAGISLPISADLAYFLFFGLYLAGQFAANYFLRNRVEVVYAQVYDALKPGEKNDGVVLGNIFQM